MSRGQVAATCRLVCAGLYSIILMNYHINFMYTCPHTIVSAVFLAILQTRNPLHVKGSNSEESVHVEFDLRVPVVTKHLEMVMIYFSSDVKQASPLI